jgi:predicted dehydrogenase
MHLSSLHIPDLIFTEYGSGQKTWRRKNYPGVKTFRTLEELLADKNIELVVVNTPSVTHYDYTKQVLNAVSM